MKAAVFETYRGALEIRSVPDPKCPADGVILKVEACGVCRSDHHGWSGVDPDVVLPHVPGHEFAGVVLAVGRDVRSVGVGERVTAPFILACGDCPDCRAGEPTICNHQHVVGFSGWGAFAELLAVPRADFNLVRLPDSLGFAEAAAMGCRLTTAFRGLVDRAGLKPGEWLAIHGCGGVGLSAVMIGAALGAQIVAIDINDEALAKAKALGANLTLNPAQLQDTALAVRDVTGGGAHVSIDGLGITQTIHNSVRSLRKLGRHVQIGQPLGQHASPPMPLLDTVYARQISILGTRGIAASRFTALLGMIAGGRLDPARMITRRIALSQAGAALQAMDGYTGVGVTVIDNMQG